MKVIFFLLLMLFSIKSFNQVKLKVYNEGIEGGFAVLADNEEYCPVFVKIDFKLNNLKSSKGNHKVFIIAARSKRNVITLLKSVKKGSYGFNYKTKFNYSSYLSKVDTSYVYNLPFKVDSQFNISQGHFGKRTHMKERALDFSLPIGTDVYAAREGIVIDVVDYNTKTCYHKDCSKYNNKIIIYHNDGSFSEYVHIDTNTAKVKIGEKVLKGQLIAKSGNIGWSSGPHLHFSVYLQNLDKRKFYETKFKVYEDGVPVILRREGIYYLD
ncbi:M23 family metallopeptidase [Polaribacter sp. Asnod1-A03]|uniref:M23 family metallopeptidase n=1 Tax=Polaribacter sp. Asnod1-A03 TaxID=3160581 RepID=UPI003863A9D4